MSWQMFRLAHTQARHKAMEAVRTAPDGFIVKVHDPTRSLEQNCAMWRILQAFADQLQWPVNGGMVNLTADEYKEILSSAFHQENVRVAQGLNGGVVMLGKRTSKFGVREMSDFIEFITTASVERGIELDYEEHSDPWPRMQA